jgi:hypothetical protein
LKFELCRNAGCTAATSSDDFAKEGTAFAAVGESPAFLGARFYAARSDGGPSTLWVSAWPRGKLTDGDSYALSVLDADSGAKLFVHEEPVTYTRGEACGLTCLAARITLDGGVPEAALDQ